MATVAPGKKAPGRKSSTGKDLAAYCRDQLADLRALARELTDEEWAASSLCAGWTVKDVYAHLLGGRVISPVRAVCGIARHRGLTRWSYVKTKALARITPTDELIAVFERETSRWPERGVAGVEPHGAKLADNVVHELDIRRAIGRPRAIAPDRLAAALCGSLSTNMWGNKSRARGLRFEATDSDWSHGSGPLVSGPAADLLLAINGRRNGLGALSGDGVALLAGRCPG